jgi:hypothetical protein
MYDNHRNHAAFMANVMWLNNYQLLADILPWVYRAYTARGFSLDYFPKVLAAGKAAIRELLPADLAPEPVAVYDWVISRHPDLAKGSDRSAFTLRMPMTSGPVSGGLSPKAS